jgi:hypothetical protein
LPALSLLVIAVSQRHTYSLGIEINCRDGHDLGVALWLRIFVTPPNVSFIGGIEVSMDVEAEIQELKRRLGDLEGIVNVLTGQMRRVHPELVSIRAESAKRFDGADEAMARIIQRLDTMNVQVWSLRDDLPEMLKGAILGINLGTQGN